MIYNINYSNGNRDYIISMLKNKRLNEKFTVIDVGGTTNCWTSEFVDAICDILSIDTDKIKVFKININLPNEWKEVDEYVKENGKFNFSICSHTLEDISNPKFVCIKLTEISKGGYIAVPSKFRELSRFEDISIPYRGYMHHRWIFDFDKDHNFIGFPKIPYLEYEDKFDSIATMNQHFADLSFYWKDELKLDIINNDYLGPSGNDVKGYYEKLLDLNI
jgi:hypothetical protein